MWQVLWPAQPMLESFILRPCSINWIPTVSYQYLMGKKPNANTIFFYSINVMKVCWLFQFHISILPSLKLSVYSSPKMKYFNSINALFSVKRKLYLTSAIYLWMIQWENTNRFEQVTIFFMKSFSIFMDKF